MYTIYENTTLGQKDFQSNEILNIEAIDCTVDMCELSEKLLLNNTFNNCTFSNCNLSLSKFNNVQFNNVIFNNCKILGVDFSKCTGFLFEVYFYDSVLDFSSFENMKMLETIFSKSSMKGVDFSGTNLQKSIFRDVDLQDAIFSRTNLKESDLSTAVNFRISPTQNYLKKAIFSEKSLSGLLDEFDLRVV